MYLFHNHHYRFLYDNLIDDIEEYAFSDLSSLELLSVCILHVVMSVLSLYPTGHLMQTD